MDKNSKKIAVTGAAGLLGSNIVKVASSHFDVFGIDLIDVPARYCKLVKLDLTNRQEVEKNIKGISPDAIIHCAALTDVEYCEAHPDETKKVNVEATSFLARVSKELGVKLIYISTDSVFDGERGMYKEDDTANPLNVYAQSKLEGEEIIKTVSDDFVIARTNIYGWNMRDKTSFGEWVLNGLLKGEHLTMFTDVIFCPMFVNHLAEILLGFCREDIKGTYHVASRESCSKHEFALRLANIFGLSSESVSPISVEDFSFKAKRPPNTSLNIDKISSLGIKLPDVDEGLQLFKELLASGYVGDLKGRSFRKEMLGG